MGVVGDLWGIIKEEEQGKEEEEEGNNRGSRGS